MVSEKIVFANGWEIRVSMLDDVLYITAQHTEGDTIRAQTTIVKATDQGIEFCDWHPTSHAAAHCDGEIK